ncbi:coiled-coil domain-containing protein 137 [Venturia canescens]|uniref:coiled-coil domain-containing protein 137 n=1 Tax=Venturia canescens TaxID=32260 RepID=UPI001C9C180F|nr:coiled-coil domain-containing protein 137 [Venturia canescens]
MGRKIPGKKHRTIKDPEKQRAKRWAELKTKINEPPKDVNEQAIPKSLERVMKLKEAVKSGKIVAKKRKRKSKSQSRLITLGSQNPTMHPNAKPEKSVPIFNQNPGESNSDFWNRVNRETHLFLNETTFEKKYNVEIKRNPETGDIEGVQKAPKDEIDELMKLQMKYKNIGKKKKKKNLKSSEIEPKLTKVQKRKLKLKMRKEKKDQDKIDNSYSIREKIEFGDIAHAPPDLKLKPLKPREDRMPGKKDLLLNSLLTSNHSPKETKTGRIKIDKTGKRKDLPSAERRILEKQQSDVIAAYRLLKTRNAQAE